MESNNSNGPDDTAYRASLFEDAAKEKIDLATIAKGLGLAGPDALTTAQLEDAILNATTAPAQEKTTAPVASSAPIASSTGLSAEEQLKQANERHAREMAAMQKQMEEMARVRPANAAPAGTFISPGVNTSDAEERKLLFEQALALGLKFDASASTAGMRDNIQRHITDKIQARQAVEHLEKEAAKAGPARMKRCRVLPMGDGKISKGFHIGGRGDAMYSRGDIAEFEESIAIAQETAGRVEIVGDVA